MKRPQIPSRARAASVRTILAAARTEVRFCPFPQHVLLQIIDYVPRQALTTLLRVNSAFYWITLPILYQQLILSTHGPWPHFNTSIKLPPKGDFRSWLERNPLTSRVKQVDVLPHSSKRCMALHISLEFDAFKPMTNCIDRLPQLPYLKTLRIHVTPGRGLHPDESNRFAADIPEGIGLVPQCAVVHNLRPRKLVLVGGPSVSSASGLTSLPYGVLAAAAEYVLVLYPDAEMQDAHKSSQVPLLRARAIAADLAHANVARKATITFHPHTPWDEFRAVLGVRAYLTDSWAGRFFAELGRQLSQLSESVSIKLVNTGAIDHGALGMEDWDPEQGADIVESTLRDAFRQEQLATYKAGRRNCVRSSQVKFITMAEYLCENGTEDELGAARLHEWHHPRFASLSPRSTPRATLTRRGPGTPMVIPPTPRNVTPRTASGSRIVAATQVAARKVSDKVADKVGSESRMGGRVLQKVKSIEKGRAVQKVKSFDKIKVEKLKSAHRVKSVERLRSTLEARM